MPFRLELTIGTTCASSYGCVRVLRFWIHLCVELWLFSFSPLLGPLVRRAMIVFVFSDNLNQVGLGRPEHAFRPLANTLPQCVWLSSRPVGLYSVLRNLIRVRLVFTACCGI